MSSERPVRAQLVALQAPLTLRATKEAHDLVLLCYMSQDFREGMEAFLGKRKPVWRGV